MKVVFYDAETEELMDYDPEKHRKRAYKFLFYKADEAPEDLLIVGGPRVETYEKDFTTHRDLYKEISSPFFDNPLQYMRRPSGAGDCEDGKIYGWRSAGFEIITPHELRPSIIEALGFEQQ